MSWYEDLAKNGWLGTQAQLTPQMDAQKARQSAGRYGNDISPDSMSGNSYSDPTAQALINVRQKTAQRKEQQSSEGT